VSHHRSLAHRDRVGWYEIGAPANLAAETVRGRVVYLAGAYQRSLRHVVVAGADFEPNCRLPSAFRQISFGRTAERNVAHFRGIPGPRFENGIDEPLL
jgi:hypothetical protein